MAVFTAQYLGEQLGKVAQHRIPGLVPIVVVDALEMVQIQQHQSAGMGALLDQLDVLFQQRRDVPSVTQACEGIGQRCTHGLVAFLAQQAFVVAQVGDVAANAQHGAVRADGFGHVDPAPIVQIPLDAPVRELAAAREGGSEPALDLVALDGGAYPLTLGLHHHVVPGGVVVFSQAKGLPEGGVGGRQLESNQPGSG